MTRQEPDENAVRGRRPSGVLLGLLGLVLPLVLGAVAWAGAADASSDLTRFGGRLHPVVVHLPIGVLLVVVLAEVGCAFAALRRRIEPALGLLLAVLVVTSCAALALGLLLAEEGGYPPHLLARHRTLTVGAVLGAALAAAFWEVHRARGAGFYRGAYRGVLGLTAGLFGVGAHFGGAMTHGEGYLGRFAPAPLRGLLGGAEVVPAVVPAPGGVGSSPRVYAEVLAPVLASRCAECHGAAKARGGLRVDSLEALLAGGQSGPAVVRGAPLRSPVLVRASLPEDHDARMPPAGRTGLTAGELALLAWWIERGADPAVTVGEVLPPPAARALLERAAGSTPSPAPRPGPSPSALAVIASAAASSPAPPKVGEGAAGAALDGAVAPGAMAVLGKYCVECHGPTQQKAKLRVDSVAALLAGGVSGPAITLGQAERSAVVRRMRLPVHDADHMPPARRPQPSPAEIAAVAAYIAATRVAPPPPAPAPVASTPTAEPTPEVGQAVSSSAPPPGAPPAPGAEEPRTPWLPERIDLYAVAVAPVLDARCGGCHLGEPLMGGYSLEDPRVLVAAGSIVPGQPEASELYRRLTLPREDDEHMPPGAEPQPTSGEIALIEYWIANGARVEGEQPAAGLPPLVAQTVAAWVTPPPAAPHVATPAQGVGQPPAASAPRAGGCAACSVGWGRDAAWLGLGAGAAAVVLVVHRRRRRPGGQSRQWVP